MFRKLFVFSLIACLWIDAGHAQDKLTASLTEEQASELERLEGTFLTNIRQIIFEGLRSGEGYYSADGKKLVFQSERMEDNPFYQIYLQDLETGDIQRVTPGIGKSTCAWVAPNGQQVLFASTQFDPEAKDKQQKELAERASGIQKRYSWDYDPQYELILWNAEDGSYRQLTNALGYDAEGCISPDGKHILFASNRRAYTGELTPREQQLFAVDPSSAMDLYIMDIDGQNIKQLTSEIGYDGGPFFSPDGSRYCWRHFEENGLVAEIYTANLDGTDVRRLTSLQKTSWAPFFHPSGDYLIFTTNVHGFDNFELYIVDALGKHEPVRVTTFNGFDGLGVFTPDGQNMTWASGRTTNKKPQLFTANWNDAAARQSLGIDATSSNAVGGRAVVQDNQLLERATQEAQATAQISSKSFSAADIGRHIDYLCRPELGGRLTGTSGEKAASAYVAAYFSQLGLEPVFGDDANAESFTQVFPFVSSITLGDSNSLVSDGIEYEVDKQWRPLALSADGDVQASPVVFAGYGIVAPGGEPTADQKEEDVAEYSSYVHLDVTGKWVLVFRNIPDDISAERRAYLSRFASLRYKAMMAREQGAIGLIVVSGPTSQINSQLVPLTTDGSLSGSQIAAISITDDVAEKWLSESGEDLAELQKSHDSGEMQMGFELEKVRVSSTIDVEPVQSHGQNTVALLRSDEENAPTVIVGAHIDHLGAQAGSNSLALSNERDQVHRGADDNASGVAGMLEIAEYLSSEVKSGRLKLKSNVMFAAWSGEELGLLGSAYFTEHLPQPLVGESDSVGTGEQQNAEASPASAHGVHSDSSQASRKISACINLDMIGRLRETLVVQGTGSSPAWRSEIEQRNSVVGLTLTLQDDSYLPTDASSFYMAGIPILSAFTGQHSEYHTPRDVPELINFEGAAKTSQLFGLIARSLAASGEVPEYARQQSPQNAEVRVSMRAYLGTVPDYIAADVEGLKLADVTPGAPADKAGVRKGDVVIELAGKKIANVYDYTYAIEALKIGETTTIVVNRNGENVKLDVTPSSRQ